MIQREPHPTFVRLWAAWLFLTAVTLILPGEQWLRYVWALSFFAIEMPGMVMYNGGLRDTLSELTTYAQRSLSPRTRVPYRGWNALLFSPVILIIAGLATQMISWGLGPALSVPVFILLVVGLYDHLLSPDVWG